MRRISSIASEPLYTVAATRAIEIQAAQTLPPHTLMQRAGLAVARLALALAPHAQKIWIACGPGNNGGDGFEAALRLHQWGKCVVMTWTGPPQDKNGMQIAMPADAAASRKRALAAGVTVSREPPIDFDFCIDALLGIGGKLDLTRPGTAQMLHWLGLMHSGQAGVLAIDLPTGLNADTGQGGSIDAPEFIAVRAGIKRARGTFYLKNLPEFHTLSLLTLKPGLFTAQGRDLAGEVWFDDLDTASARNADDLPSAWLLGSDRAPSSPRSAQQHDSHKGTFGDVAVVGGESTLASHMAGAVLLAARAALHAGAGRVFVALLAGPDCIALSADPVQPELMFRQVEALDLKHQVVVCGCGGGDAIREVLPKLLSTAQRLVLDADALNAIARDVQLQTLLRARNARGYGTILTPHPLEAARLAALTTNQVQADRLQLATQLSKRFMAVVVLKGSGTVIAGPGRTTVINASGNALLATGGTGDVLAGMVGAWWAGGLDAFDAALGAVFTHGQMADDWSLGRPGQLLTASVLASAGGQL